MLNPFYIAAKIERHNRHCNDNEVILGRDHLTDAITITIQESYALKPKTPGVFAHIPKNNAWPFFVDSVGLHPSGGISLL